MLSVSIPATWITSGSCVLCAIFPSRRRLQPDLPRAEHRLNTWNPCLSVVMVSLPHCAKDVNLRFWRQKTRLESFEMTLLEQYAARFGELRVDRQGTRPRPHKAVMLLSVMALAESGRLVENRILYSAELLEIFARFFELVRAGNDRCTPFNPFFHLRNDGFWHLHPQPGAEPLLQRIGTVQSAGQLLELVLHASVDPELLALFGNREHREALREVLITSFFPARRDAVIGLCREEDSIARCERDSEAGDIESAERVAECVRDTAFTRLVRRVYDYTCAMCGVRFVCDDVILVDAAHLIPFAESHDDSPSNGMALCKNHHWLMDRHLIAPGPARGADYSTPVWLVSPLLDRRLEAHRACIEHKGDRVLLPREARYRPSERALSWRVEHLKE
jgi:putative restriction endonuclease